MQKLTSEEEGEEEEEEPSLSKHIYGLPADTDYTAAVYRARIQGHPTVNGLTHNNKLGRQHSFDRPTDRPTPT